MKYRALNENMLQEIAGEIDLDTDRFNESRKKEDHAMAVEHDLQENRKAACAGHSPSLSTAGF